MESPTLCEVKLATLSISHHIRWPSVLIAIEGRQVDLNIILPSSLSYTSSVFWMHSVRRTRALLRAPTIYPQLGHLNLSGTICRYHQTAILQQPYKDDQDRESLKPRAQDTSKSTSDDDAAIHDDAAFDPNITSPETAKNNAEQDSNGNPLEVSPANKDVSRPKVGGQ